MKEMLGWRNAAAGSGAGGCVEGREGKYGARERKKTGLLECGDDIDAVEERTPNKMSQRLKTMKRSMVKKGMDSQSHSSKTNSRLP
jgi:hypothetical protein